VLTMLSRARSDTLLLGLSDALRSSGDDIEMTAVLVRSGAIDISPAVNHQPVHALLNAPYCQSYCPNHGRRREFLYIFISPFR